MADLMLAYHQRSDHGRDGAELDSRLCNCRQLFDAHAKDLLAEVKHKARPAHPDTMIGRLNPPAADRDES